MYYYKQVKSGEIVSVEAKSRDSLSSNFAKATKVEYDEYLASLPVPTPEPQIDLVAEIAKLNERLNKAGVA